MFREQRECLRLVDVFLVGSIVSLFLVGIFENLFFLFSIGCFLLGLVFCFYWSRDLCERGLWSVLDIEDLFLLPEWFGEVRDE